MESFELINQGYHKSEEYDLLKTLRKKRSLLKLMNLTNNSGVYCKSRFLSYQKVKDHLRILSSGSNKLI